MKNGLHLFFIMLCVLAIAGAGWYFFGRDAHRQDGVVEGQGKPSASRPNGAQPMPVITVLVQTTTLSWDVSAVGSLQAAESADLRAEIAGQVKAVPLQEGQLVKKGQVLVALDDSIIKTELAKAEAVLINAKATFNRSEELQKNNYVSKQELDQSKASYQEAKAVADSARIRLDKINIKAPFDGIAGLRNFSVGDYIQVGDLLTTVDMINPIKVDFTVPEKNFSDIKPGQQIIVETDAFPGRKFLGEIYALDARINPDTRNFHVKAMVANDEHLLRSGMFGRIMVKVGERQGILVIPEEAITPEGSEQYVFMVKEGKAVMVRISTGRREAGKVQVLEGLQEGDEVITEGVLRIRDGSPIIVKAPAIARSQTEPVMEKTLDKEAP